MKKKMQKVLEEWQEEHRGPLTDSQYDEYVGGMMVFARLEKASREENQEEIKVEANGS